MKQNQDKVIDPDKMVCPVIMENGKPCGRRSEDTIEWKCLFHCARLQEVDKLRFQRELDKHIKEIEDQNLRYYDFTKFHFSIVNFNTKIF